MNGVKFGTNHSYEDFNLILTKKTIGAAVPKTSTIDVPGADGELDYTEYFGKVNYKNRTLEFEFASVIPQNEFLTQFSQLQNLLNGRKFEITLDEDPDFYYTGRVFVNEWKSNSRIGKIVIEVNAAPYKLRRNVTIVSTNATGATILNCHNSKKEVVPKITLSAEGTVAFGQYPVTFSGSRTDDEIIFVEGQNVLTITPTSGTISVIVEYQEGKL